LTVIEQSLIIFFMRVKDENKKEAIFEAIIELLNEVGFANLSMSQIAKRAGVSSSTIYVYFENKEDMLKTVYMDVKKKFVGSLLQGVEQSIPVRQAMEKLIQNLLEFALTQTAYFFFMEQCSNAPMKAQPSNVDAIDMMKPVFKIFEKGQQKGILKPGDSVILLSFCYHGVTQIAKDKLKRDQCFSDSEVKELIQMCWDAIRK